jgi:hypothetical protein
LEGDAGAQLEQFGGEAGEFFQRCHHVLVAIDFADAAGLFRVG